MNVQLTFIVLLLAQQCLLSLGNDLNELGKQITALKIKISRQETELKKIKNRNSKLKEVNLNLKLELGKCDEKVDNLSIDQEDQFENLTELDGNEETYNITNSQQKQIDFLISLGNKLEKKIIALEEKIQAKIETISDACKNITDDHREQIESNVMEQYETLMERFTNITSKLSSRLDQQIQLFVLGNNTISKSNNTISKSNNTISNCTNNTVRNNTISKCIWQGDDGISFSKMGLYHENYVRLELMSAKGYLGCPQYTCDLRTCPAHSSNYKNFDKCSTERFQIYAYEGHGSIKSGQKVLFKYGINAWLGCPSNSWCQKKDCPSLATNISICWGEIFQIHACGRANGEHIQNGDLVMIYYSGEKDLQKKYLAIQGSSEGDDTSLSICPSGNPPTDSSFFVCPYTVFRIHRKP